MNLKSIPTLDKGYIALTNIAGTWRIDELDPIIARTARQSFDNTGFSDIERDIKLTKHLSKKEHTSPIEMIETWWEMKLPIFVARQFVR